jgi:hypothetical protein
MTRVSWSALPPMARERLVGWHRDGRAADGFYQARDPRRRLVKCLALGGGGAAVATAIAVALAPGPAIGFAIVAFVALELWAWTATLVLELRRRAASEVKPFAVVTPIEVVLVEYDTTPVVGAALDEVTELARIHADGGALRYVFRGPQPIELIVAGGAEQAALDGVLDAARRLKGDDAAKRDLRARAGVLPGGAGEAAGLDAGRPFSEFWLLVAGLNCLAVIVAIVAGRVLS